MSQTPFVGAPQGAVWGFDPTTNLWLPIGASPEIIGPNGEIYGSLLTYITNANNNGQNVMANSQSVAIASDQSSIPIKSGLVETLNLTAGALNADLLPATDISSYALISLQVTGTWVGTLQVQQSNDQTTWTSQIATFPLTRNTNSILTANNIITFNKESRWVRVRMIAYTSGTATGLAEFFTTGQEIVPGSITANPGNTANTTPWLVSSSNNNFVQAAGGSTTVGKASPGLLVGGIVTATGTVGLTVFDNVSAASGTPLLVIPANPTVGQLFPVNGWAKNGITSGGVANCPGVTFFFA